MAWTRQSSAVLASAFGALMLVLGNTASGERLEKQASTTTIEGDTYGSATAKCSKTEKAISGGFVSPFDPDAPLPEQPNVLVRNSVWDSGRRWTSRAHNSSPADGTLTSFAYCRAEAIFRRTFSTEIGPDELGSVAVKCFKGERAVSGGFATRRADTTLPGIPTLSVIASRKLGNRRWQASAFNFGDVAGRLSVQANCREGGGKLKTRKDTETPQPLEAVNSRADCPLKRRVVSGGFEWTNFGESNVRLLASMKAHKIGWRVTFLDMGGPSPAEVSAYAYCEKKRAR
jgi:hypothetical protein